MECKFDYSNGYNSLTEELIETLWNVNDYRIVKKINTQKELIETLWNVNYA